MAPYRSLSETRRPRRHFNTDGASSGPNARETDSDLIPMVRNCSSCLDLYHRMIGLPRNISRVELSGDGLTIAGHHRVLELEPNDVQEPIMGEADDYEVPTGTDQQQQSLPTARGSCVYLFRKDTSEWHFTRDWQDLFDMELVVVEPTVLVPTAAVPTPEEPSEPPFLFIEAEYADEVQDPVQHESHGEGNNNVADVAEPVVTPEPPQFDKATTTGKKEGVPEQ